MTPDQRTAVRDTAKYLRNIRPIEPSELQDYVTGQPHPAAIREVLREAAVEIGLVEQPNGTFVPVPDDPVSPLGEPVTEFPERYESRLLDLLVDEYGPQWARDQTGDRLRSTIRQLKAEYHHGATVTYDTDTAFGYAIYHLADYYATSQYVCSVLADGGLLSPSLRVLDVGAGVGGPALGLADLLPGDALLAYEAIEPSDPARGILTALMGETGRNTHCTVHPATAETADPEGTFDLILFANVLSELPDPIATVRRYATKLSPDGTLVLIAPADRTTSTHLRMVERALADTHPTYAPTLRLWPEYTPADDCWSFDRQPELAIPRVQRRLDEAGDAAGEFINVDVQYSYAILRPDVNRYLEFEPTDRELAPMADSPAHVTERVDLAAIKLSHSLSDDGHPLFLIGDGSQQVDHYAVLVNETSLNAALRTAGYGALLRFDGGLVLWNDDEQAVNVVVDEDTVVDLLAPGPLQGLERSRNE